MFTLNTGPLHLLPPLGSTPPALSHPPGFTFKAASSKGVPGPPGSPCQVGSPRPPTTPSMGFLPSTSPGGFIHLSYQTANPRRCLGLQYLAVLGTCRCLLGGELCPPKRYTEVPTPEACDCDLIWK